MIEETYSREESKYLKVGIYAAAAIALFTAYYVTHKDSMSHKTTEPIILSMPVLTVRTACSSETGFVWPAWISAELSAQSWMTISRQL